MNHIRSSAWTIYVYNLHFSAPKPVKHRNFGSSGFLVRSREIHSVDIVITGLMLMLPPRSGGNTCPKPNAGKSGATSRIHNRSKCAFAFTATHDLPLQTRKNRIFTESFGAESLFLSVFPCFTGGNRGNRESLLPS
jgi:hypothetical protein